VKKRGHASLSGWEQRRETGLWHRLRLPGLPGYITPRELIYAYVVCWLIASVVTMLWVFLLAWSSPETGYRITVAVNDQGEMLVEQAAFFIFVFCAVYVVYDQARIRLSAHARAYR